MAGQGDQGSREGQHIQGPTWAEIQGQDHHLSEKLVHVCIGVDSGWVSSGYKKILSLAPGIVATAL
jgi:hypothetical protein